MSLRDHSIYDCIINNAHNFPDEIAFVSGDLRLSYVEVHKKVNLLYSTSFSNYNKTKTHKNY